MSLSVVLVAQDEERNIERVLSAVKPIADEIVLVDSGSTDRTVEIAKEHGALCHFRQWPGFAEQKNYAMSLATGDWVLSLDADEVLSSELVAEIKQLLASSSATAYDGYRIPRVLYIGDKPVRHGGFYPDAQLRLIKRGAGTFNDRLVHEAIKISGPVGVLSNAMHHYAYATVEEFSSAMESTRVFRPASLHEAASLAGDAIHSTSWFIPSGHFFIVISVEVVCLMAVSA